MGESVSSNNGHNGFGRETKVLQQPSNQSTLVNRNIAPNLWPWRVSVCPAVVVVVVVVVHVCTFAKFVETRMDLQTGTTTCDLQQQQRRRRQRTITPPLSICAKPCLTRSVPTLASGGWLLPLPPLVVMVDFVDETNNSLCDARMERIERANELNRSLLSFAAYIGSAVHTPTLWFTHKDWFAIGFDLTPPKKHELAGTCGVRPSLVARG
jgi:hypothetical protein